MKKERNTKKELINFTSAMKNLGRNMFLAALVATAVLLLPSSAHAECQQAGGTQVFNPDAEYSMEILNSISIQREEEAPNELNPNAEYDMGILDAAVEENSLETTMEGLNPNAEYSIDLLDPSDEQQDGHSTPVSAPGSFLSFDIQACLNEAPWTVTKSFEDVGGSVISDFDTEPGFDRSQCRIALCTIDNGYKERYRYLGHFVYSVCFEGPEDTRKTDAVKRLADACREEKPEGCRRVDFVAETFEAYCLNDTDILSTRPKTLDALEGVFDSFEALAGSWADGCCLS